MRKRILLKASLAGNCYTNMRILPHIEFRLTNITSNWRSNQSIKIIMMLAGLFSLRI